MDRQELEETNWLTERHKEQTEKQIDKLRDSH